MDGGNRRASAGAWTGVTLRPRGTEATASRACYVTAVTGAPSQVCRIRDSSLGDVLFITDVCGTP